MPDIAENKKVYHHIDLLRFAFSVLVVYYHVLNANILPYVTNPRFEELGHLVRYSSNIVICFFLISGFFLYRSFRSHPNQSIFEYIVSRVVRLWPVMAVDMIAEAVLSGNFNWQRTLINGMFLQCSGISLEYRGILWYVSAFFFATIFLYAVLKTCSERASGLVIALVTYFCTAFLVNYNNGLIGGRETVLYVLNIGILRGVAFMGTGILLAMIQEKLSAMLKLTPVSRLTETVLFCIKVILEGLALYFLYIYFLRSQSMSNHIVLVLVFSLFLLCLVSEKDPLGQLLNRKPFGYPGKYAYSIYVMQGTGFLLLQKTLWKNETFVSNVWLAIGVSTLVPVAVGIAAYYLVEKPCSDAFQKWYSKYRIAVKRERERADDR